MAHQIRSCYNSGNHLSFFLTQGQVLARSQTDPARGMVRVERCLDDHCPVLAILFLSANVQTYIPSRWSKNEEAGEVYSSCYDFGLTLHLSLPNSVNSLDLDTRPPTKSNASTQLEEEINFMFTKQKIYRSTQSIFMTFDVTGARKPFYFYFIL
jgi:hypothetical protein